jgi:hypothetical protein
LRIHCLGLGCFLSGDPGLSCGNSYAICCCYVTLYKLLAVVPQFSPSDLLTPFTLFLLDGARLKASGGVLWFLGVTPGGLGRGLPGLPGGCAWPPKRL